VLYLVAPHRYVLRVKQQNVGRHQDGIGKKPHGDAIVGIHTLVRVLIHDGFVGVRAIHQALGGHAVQHPAQLRDFGNVGLAVERDHVRVQSGGKPRGGNLQARTGDALRIIAFNQRMVVRQKVQCVHVGAAAGENGRPNGPGVIAQMWRARRRDTGEYACGHGGHAATCV